MGDRTLGSKQLNKASHVSLAQFLRPTCLLRVAIVWLVRQVVDSLLRSWKGEGEGRGKVHPGKGAWAQ
jgi:hypothetical protein